nr:MAG TPA: hypothetical protein [Caudoviricetes sp.]
MPFLGRFKHLRKTPPSESKPHTSPTNGSCARAYITQYQG